jgi:N-acyl-L-homoserine lactone synthetase
MRAPMRIDVSGRRAPPTRVEGGLSAEAAEQVLANLAPLGFRVARSAAERESAYRLRCQCVIEEGWGIPEDFPNGMECDHHDGHAVQIVAWDGGTVAGTMRLVTPRRGVVLPVEEAFDLRIEPVGEVVDAGRIVVASAYRHDPALRVLSGLLTRVWLEARGRGYHLIAGTAPAWLADLYQRMGISVQVLGPARRYWGEERLPLLFADTATALTWLRAGR